MNSSLFKFSSKKLIIILFISLTMFFNCSKESTAPNSDYLGTIAGKITDSANGSAIQGASVFTDPSTSSVLSDNDGNYTIKNIEPGTYTVIAAKAGYDTNSVSVTVSRGKSVNANISISILTSSISGIILDSFLGSPVSGAKVTTQPFVDSVFSDTNGSFLIENVPIGEYTVIATKIGYDTISVNIELSPGSVVESEIILPIARRLVAIGNSFVAGWQSGGLVKDFQYNSFPYLIAAQMGIASTFEQPIIDEPGISNTPGFGPLKFVNGQIVAGDPYPDPNALLLNLLLPVPYDNLGIPGANLNDVLSTLSGAGNGNFFFDIVLRNPFPIVGNLSMMEQVIALNPKYSLIFIGINDYLGAALSGSNTGITPQTDFEMIYTEIINQLQTRTNAKMVIGNLPEAEHFPYVNMLDIIFRAVPQLGINEPVPVVFDAMLQPIDFGGGLFIPLLTEETDVSHLLLPMLSQYQFSGLGIPDSAALVAMGISPLTAQQIIENMVAAGMTPSGIPIPQNLSLTDVEVTTIENAVAGYNNFLNSLSTANQIPLVDIHTLFADLYTSGVSGVSGLFVFLDVTNTGFSLDGVHPNNAGYALIANEYIKVMNQYFSLSLPLLNVDQFKGQYTGN